jgi:hypothetical protein
MAEKKVSGVNVTVNGGGGAQGHGAWEFATKSGEI